MKRLVTLTIAMMALATVMATATEAQTAGSQTMRARVPFSFHVGSKVLPAGEYNITVLNPNSDHKVLQIRSRDGATSAIVNTFGAKAKAAANSKLAFHRYGESYFFAAAQVVGESTALTAMKSSAERSEAAVARRESKPVVAIVNAF